MMQLPMSLPKADENNFHEIPLEVISFERQIKISLAL